MKPLHHQPAFRNHLISRPKQEEFVRFVGYPETGTRIPEPSHFGSREPSDTNNDKSIGWNAASGRILGKSATLHLVTGRELETPVFDSCEVPLSRDTKEK